MYCQQNISIQYITHYRANCVFLLRLLLSVYKYVLLGNIFIFSKQEHDHVLGR